MGKQTITMSTSTFPRTISKREKCDGTDEVVQDVEFDVQLNSETNYGDNLPNWRELIARGENATTDMHNSEETVVDSYPGYILVDYERCTFRGDRINQTQGFWDTQGALDKIDPNSYLEQPARNAALQEFTSKIRDRLASFSGGVAAGELGETLRMIRNPAKALRRSAGEYLATLKKGKHRYKRSKDRKQFLAETYLEYAFGWSPLIGDINDAIASLARWNEGVVNSDYVTAWGEARDVDETETDLFAYGLCRVDWTWRRDYKVKYIFRGKVRAEVAHPTLGQHFGFRVEEFVPTAWELLPYSFLVDYFSNVGEVLVGWSYGSSLLKWTNHTIVREAEIRAIDQRVPVQMMESAYSLYKWRLLQFRPMRYAVRTKTVDRTTWTGSLVPDLQFEVPGMGSQKWVNMAALLRAHNSLTPYYR